MKINNILTGLYKSKPAQRYLNWVEGPNAVVNNNIQPSLKNYAKLQKIFPPAFLCFLSLVQSIFLAKSKEMPEERKVPLILNQVYSCIIALSIGAIFGKNINKMTEHLVKRAGEIFKETGAQPKIINGIKTGIPVLKEAFLFEFVGYVAAVPLGTQTANWLKKKGYLNLSPKNTDQIKNKK